MWCNWICWHFNSLKYFFWSQCWMCAINAYYSLFVMIIMGLNVFYEFIVPIQFCSMNEILRAVVWEGIEEKWKESALFVASIFNNFTPFSVLLSPAINIQHEYANILMTRIKIIIIIINTNRLWNWWITQHVMQIIRCYILW